MSTMDLARTAGTRYALAAASRPHRSSAMTKAVTCVLVFAVLVCAAQPALAQFTQQGPKLVGNGAVGGAKQGWSVSLSGDGNAAIVGGTSDNSGAGAAWVFSRGGGVWAQK